MPDFVHLSIVSLVSKSDPSHPIHREKERQPARNPGPDSTGRLRRMCLMDRLKVRQGTATTVLSVSRLPVLVISLAVCRLSICLFSPPPSLTHSLTLTHGCQLPYPILSLSLSAPPPHTHTHTYTHTRPSIPKCLGKGRKGGW